MSFRNFRQKSFPTRRGSGSRELLPTGGSTCRVPTLEEQPDEDEETVDAGMENDESSANERSSLTQDER